MLSNSPCIDRGSNAQFPSHAADLDADNNLIERLPFDLDLNPRRIDVPAVTDLGEGTTPLVDIGAFEFAPSCELSADLDSDGDVDLQDLATLLGHFGQTSGATPEFGDSDGDTDVDLQDLAGLLSQFGFVCP